ncbi:MAG: FMN-binding protein [Clostridia bacterium]
MKRKRKIGLLVLTVFIGLVLVIMGAKAYIESNLEALADQTISNVDLSKAEDGVYVGSYKAFPVAAEVEVTISNHRISGIELKKHENGQGLPAEIIPGKVVEAQTLEVDIVAGATYSSKVILKAIEDALNQANRQ